MNEKITVLIVFILGFSMVEAQNWVALDSAKMNVINNGTLFLPDSITGKLFIAGDLTTIEGHQSWEIAAWDGSNWDTTYSFGAYGGGQIKSIIRYQNELYACGAFSTACHKYTMSFTRWNANCWDSLIINHHSNYIEDLRVYNNLLFMTGEIDTICGIYSPNSVAWNGNSFIPKGLPHWSSGNSMVCCVFHNALYFAGNFSDSIGFLYGFVKFDGTNWSMPYPGFGGLVQTMAVYNDELYIGGNYFAGGPADFIVKWNDTTLSAVGSGLSTGVGGLRVIDNKLFVLGTNMIRVWDGSNWSNFSNDSFNNAILDVTIYNNELYVLGGFTKINGDSIGGVAKYNGWHLSDHDIKSTKGELEIFPNPTSDVLNILLDLSAQDYHKQVSIKIIDVMGRTIIEKDENSNTILQTVLNISDLSNATYLLQVIIGSKIYNKTFILNK